jgi:hypothetical protein
MDVFSVKHKKDTRQNIKAAWNLWIIENNELVTTELTLLKNKGFTGTKDDLLYKLFFSVKYYVMKGAARNVTAAAVTAIVLPPRAAAAAPPIKIKISKSIITDIDNFLNKNEYNDKPNNCYLYFINIYKENIYNEMMRLQHDAKPAVVLEKIKKSFKNRYYNARAAAAAE